MNQDSPYISFGVLRKIADQVKDIPFKDVIELLEENNVPKELLNSEDTSTKDLMYHVLKKLALTDTPEAEKTLKTLILATLNPAIYPSATFVEKQLFDLYNQWLKSENKEILQLGRKGYRLVDTLAYDPEREEISQQDAQLISITFMEVVKPFQPQIKEIQEAYSLLLSIINALMEQSISITNELNGYYMRLFEIVEDDIAFVNLGIEKERKETLAKDPLHAIGDVGKLYRDKLYKPFPNLYLANEEMKKVNNTWENIKGQMKVCYGKLVDVSRRAEAIDFKDYPNKEYFSDATKEIQKSKIITRRVELAGSLVLNLKSGKLTFHAPSGSKYGCTLERTSNEYFLLQFLMVQQPETILSHEELSRHLNDKRPNTESDGCQV